MPDFETQVLERLDRIDRALLGEEEAGHVGVVERVALVEEHNRLAPQRHEELEERRVEGDRRVHTRLDDHEELTRGRLDSIEKKLDRAIWLAVGAFAGGGLIGGGSVWAILGA
jgi:hypothetical protein